MSGFIVAVVAGLIGGTTSALIVLSVLAHIGRRGKEDDR